MAALDYKGSADLMNDVNFRGRVKVACLKYADFIMNEATSVTAHMTRLKWAQNTFMNPDAVAAQITPPTVMDPAVQSAGSAVTDTALQSAVEGVVNKVM